MKAIIFFLVGFFLTFTVVYSVFTIEEYQSFAEKYDWNSTEECCKTFLYACSISYGNSVKNSSLHRFAGKCQDNSTNRIGDHCEQFRLENTTSGVKVDGEPLDLSCKPENISSTTAIVTSTTEVTSPFTYDTPLDNYYYLAQENNSNASCACLEIFYNFCENVSPPFFCKGFENCYLITTPLPMTTDGETSLATTFQTIANGASTTEQSTSIILSSTEDAELAITTGNTPTEASTKNPRLTREEYDVLASKMGYIISDECYELFANYCHAQSTLNEPQNLCFIFDEKCIDTTTPTKTTQDVTKSTERTEATSETTAATKQQTTREYSTVSPSTEFDEQTTIIPPISSSSSSNPTEEGSTLLTSTPVVMISLGTTESEADISTKGVTYTSESDILETTKLSTIFEITTLGSSNDLSTIISISTLSSPAPESIVKTSTLLMDKTTEETIPKSTIFNAASSEMTSPTEIGADLTTISDASMLTTGKEAITKLSPSTTSKPRSTTAELQSTMIDKASTSPNGRSTTESSSTVFVSTTSVPFSTKFITTTSAIVAKTTEAVTDIPPSTAQISGELSTVVSKTTISDKEVPEALTTLNVVSTNIQTTKEPPADTSTSLISRVTETEASSTPTLVITTLKQATPKNIQTTSAHQKTTAQSLAEEKASSTSTASEITIAPTTPKITSYTPAMSSTTKSQTLSLKTHSTTKTTSPKASSAPINPTTVSVKTFVTTKSRSDKTTKQPSTITSPTLYEQTSTPKIPITTIATAQPSTSSGSSSTRRGITSTRSESSTSLEPTTAKMKNSTTTSTAKRLTTTPSVRLETTSNAKCENPCPSDYSEGSNACYKWIDASDAAGWLYSNFETSCLNDGGVIVAMNDFQYPASMILFKKLRESSTSKNDLLFTNAIPTKQYRLDHIVQSVNLTASTNTILITGGILDSVRYSNVSSICRVGKYCLSYICPKEEYFQSPYAQYLTENSSTEVATPGQSLSVSCIADPQKVTITTIKCNRRGYFLPDASMISCNATKTDTFPTEPEGDVSSCSECDEYQTSSCTPIDNGNYTCNCQEYYIGRTCQYPQNLCLNVTCLNQGVCENKITTYVCNCKADYFGSHCEYQFYNSTQSKGLRYPVTVAAAILGAQGAYNSKKGLFFRAKSFINGKTPTEFSRILATLFATMALALKTIYDVPTSASIKYKSECQMFFVSSMIFYFLALTAMIGEAIICYGTITTKMTNLFVGQGPRRPNCVKIFPYQVLYLFFAIIPIAILLYNSNNNTTPHSCIGVIGLRSYPTEIKSAAFIQISLMTVYTLFACFIGLASTQLLDNQAFTTRRRYAADRAGPFAYGIEVYPVEINVRYYLITLKPLTFTLAWLSFIFSNEQMTWWSTALAVFMSGVFSIVSTVQDNVTISSNLQDTIETAMLWLPKKWAPKYNHVSLRTRDDVLQILDPEKYAKEREEEAKKGKPLPRFPTAFDQHQDELMKTDRKGVYNIAALSKMIPTGLQAYINERWTLGYLQYRTKGLPRWKSVSRIGADMHGMRLATSTIPHSSFLNFFHHWWENMAHLDQLDDTDPTSKAVITRGIAMLNLPLSKKVPVADMLIPNDDDWNVVSIAKNDPIYTQEERQKAYDALEKLCQSIEEDQVVRDEAETAKHLAEFPYESESHEDVLTGIVINNKIVTLRDFLLDENRPNFIGPRTKENQLAPGITPLIHTAAYMKEINDEIWNRVVTRTKYELFNKKLNEDHRLWTAFLPWKAHKGYKDKNALDKHIIGELTELPLRKDSLTGIEIKQDSQKTYKRK